MKTEIKISKALSVLAKHINNLGYNLYIVGGYVRNHFMGISDNYNDIDICGDISNEEIRDICKDLGYGFQVVHKQLGTCLIIADNEKYEYTRLRAEKYPEGGQHLPINVEFVSQIKEDAKRRDFTVNALYYNTKTSEVSDFYGGLEDINQKILRCVETPEFVFENDGLRILRLVRFSCALGFKIDKKSFLAAKKYSNNLLNISRERIVGELKQILNNGHKYGNQDASVQAVRIFDKLDIYRYILPPKFKDIKLLKHKKMKTVFSKYDQRFRYTVFMLWVLFAVIGNQKTTNASLEFLTYQLLGAQGLKESTAFSFGISNMFTLFYEYANTKNFNNAFAVKFENLTELDKLMFELYDKTKHQKLLSIITALKQKNVAFNFSQMQISTQDFNDCGINNKYISLLKTIMFNEIIGLTLQNTNTELRKFLKALPEKYKHTN